MFAFKWLSAQKQNSSLNSKPQISRNVGVVMFSALVLSLVTYLVLVGSVTTKGYEIRDLEQRASSLKQQQRQLEVQTSGSQGLQGSDQSSKGSFVAVDRIEYLGAVPVGVGVAVR